MYRVIKDFCDKQDGYFRYGVGDEYPHSGLEVSEERIRELSTDKNRLNEPLIEMVEVAKTQEEPKETKTTAKKPAKRSKKE